jgi:hypothetical protein
MEYVPPVLDGHIPFSFSMCRVNDLSDFQGSQKAGKTAPVIAPVLDGIVEFYAAIGILSWLLFGGTNSHTLGQFLIRVRKFGFSFLDSGCWCYPSKA